MSDWELILTMVGEKATTDITKIKDSQGFEKCKSSAKKGGEIAGRTRKDIEKSVGKSVISKENYINKIDDLSPKLKRKFKRGINVK